MQKGFTLLEILVALTVSGILLTGAYSMLSSLMDTSLRLEEESLRKKNVTELNLIINRDIRMSAGFGDHKFEKNLDSFSFTSFHSLYLENAMPVKITYKKSDEGDFVRIEENEELDFKKEIRLLHDIKKFMPNFYNGVSYTENIDTEFRAAFFEIETQNDKLKIPFGFTLKGFAQ